MSVMFSLDRYIRTTPVFNIHSIFILKWSCKLTACQFWIENNSTQVYFTLPEMLAPFLAWKWKSDADREGKRHS